ncbi:MAG: carbohydrate kinase, partial [Lachnospiraceae bacterium]|nr:carbohydrate kinase [Lachnospiraceae bacterium]
MRILCIGEMLIDFTPVKGMDNSYTANPGGAPANVAVSAARNEIKAGFLGKLGNDDFGRLLVNTLKKDNVEILATDLTDEATTTLAFVTLDESGDRSFTFARKPGADMLLSEDDVAKVDFNEWDIVHAGSVSQSGLPERDAVLTALKKAKDCGKIVSFDINYRDKIWGFEDCKKES